MASLEETLGEIDNFIKSGDLVKAKKKISGLRLTQIPERLALRTADLLCRAGFFIESLKVLHPIIYNSLQKPSAKVVSLYALSLQLVGAYTEAGKLFKSLDFSAAPEANFHFASALISNWEYENAIPYLQRYIEHPETSSYQRLVAQINLAEAEISTGKIDAAKALLEKIMAQAEKEKHHLVLGVCHAKLVEAFANEKNFKKAKSHLAKSTKLLEASPSRYQLQTKFWEVMIPYMESPQKSSTLKNLEKLRSESVKMERWILVRECDFHHAIIAHDRDLFLKVYFGTPLPFYRNRLTKAFSENVELPAHYLWNPTGKKSGPEQLLDVKEGKDLKSQATLKRGQILHRLLQTACSDFYIPFKSETLFSYLFPGEHFNPLTSAKRCQGAIIRLHKFFEKNEIPIELRFKNNAYRIYFKSAYSIKVSLDYDYDSKFTVEDEIKKILATQAMSTDEISAALNIPTRTVQRVLQDLKGRNQVTMKKRGRDIQYSFKGETK